MLGRFGKRITGVGGHCLITLWLITLIGFVLRAYRLGFRPLWDDEAFSALIIASDIRHVAIATLRDTFPPLYYYVLSLCMMFMGRSEFAVRYASLIAGVLSIPLTYHVGKQLFDRRAGLAAALVMAFSPFMVYFAQESRAYSWMVFTSLLSVYASVRILRCGVQVNAWMWIAFVCASAAMLYTHFLSVWVLVVEGVFLLFYWWKLRRGLRRFVLAGLGVALLFSPWALLLLGVWGDVKSFAGARQIGGVQTDAPIASLLWIWQEGLSSRGSLSLAETFKQAWVSFTVGDFIPTGWGIPLASTVSLVALAGLVLFASRRGARRNAPSSGEEAGRFPFPILFVLLYALLPIVLSFLTAFPTSRPHWAKYFMMALPAYVLLIGLGVSELWGQRRYIGVLAGAIVLGASSVSLYNYLENPAYARSDIRPGIAYLEAFSAPNDALLANPPVSSPTFWYYYRGNLPHYTPEQADEALLTEVAAKHAGLWVVQNLPVPFDPDERIEKWLTYHTYRTFTEWTGQLVVRYYSMPSATGPVLAHTFDAPIEFDNGMALRSYRVQVQAAGCAQIVQLEFVWQATREIAEDFMVSVRAVDETGQVWGQTNSAPLGNFRPTSGWRPGETVADHLGLLLWPGTPPGQYTIQMWLYREADGSVVAVPPGVDRQAGGKLNLGDILVGPPAYAPLPAVLGMSGESGYEFSGMLLLGYRLLTENLRSGDTLDVQLFWQCVQPVLSQYTVSLWLEDDSGRVWNEMNGLVGRRFPTNQWTPGQIVRDVYRFALASDLPAGAYTVRLRLGDGQSRFSAPTDLTKLYINERPKRFEVPLIAHPQKVNLSNRIELLGYDLPSTCVSPGQPLSVTLYWRALSPMETSYTVFNHLVGPTGDMVGQWDSPPLEGTLPTTAWVVGEIIEDPYRIPIRANAPTGVYRLLVGMYDPITGQRLSLVDDPGKDFVELGSRIETCF